MKEGTSRDPQELMYGPERFPTLVCRSCGSRNVSPDQGWCFECMEFREIVRQEQFERENPGWN